MRVLFGRGNPPVVAPTDFGRGNPPVVTPTDFGRGNPPWLLRLWVTKRVGTGARTLPEVEGSQVQCIPLIQI